MDVELKKMRPRIIGAYFLLNNFLGGAMMLILLCKYRISGLILGCLLFAGGFLFQTKQKFIIEIFNSDQTAKKVVQISYIVGLVYSLVGYVLPFNERRFMVLGFLLLAFIIDRFAPLRRGTLDGIAEKCILSESLDSVKKECNVSRLPD